MRKRSEEEDKEGRRLGENEDAASSDKGQLSQALYSVFWLCWTQRLKVQELGDLAWLCTLTECAWLCTLTEPTLYSWQNFLFPAGSENWPQPSSLLSLITLKAQEGVVCYGLRAMLLSNPCFLYPILTGTGVLGVMGEVML